jgi:hypothetical protein
VIKAVIDVYVPEFVQSTVRNLATGIQKLAEALPQLPKLVTEPAAIDFDSGLRQQAAGLTAVRDALNHYSLSDAIRQKLNSTLDQFQSLAGIVSNLTNLKDALLSNFQGYLKLVGKTLDLTVPLGNGFTFTLSAKAKDNSLTKWDWSASCKYNVGPFAFTYTQSSSKGPLFQANAVFTTLGKITATIDLTDGKAPVTLAAKLAQGDWALDVNAEATGSGAKVTDVRLTLTDPLIVGVKTDYLTGQVGISGASAKQEKGRWKISLDVKADFTLKLPDLNQSFGKRFTELLAEKLQPLKSDDLRTDAQVNNLLLATFKEAKASFVSDGSGQGGGVDQSQAAQVASRAVPGCSFLPPSFSFPSLSQGKPWTRYARTCPPAQAARGTAGVWLGELANFFRVLVGRPVTLFTHTLPQQHLLVKEFRQTLATTLIWPEPPVFLSALVGKQVTVSGSRRLCDGQPLDGRTRYGTLRGWLGWRGGGWSRHGRRDSQARRFRPGWSRHLHLLVPRRHGLPQLCNDACLHVRHVPPARLPRPDARRRAPGRRRPAPRRRRPPGAAGPPDAQGLPRRPPPRRHRRRPPERPGAAAAGPRGAAAAIHARLRQPGGRAHPP